jgi:lambda family phage portal protein
MSFMRNFLEKTIEIISPKWSLERQRAKFLASNINKFDGASMYSRSLRSMDSSVGSASTDFPEGERNVLVARSRDAYRNQPIAKGVIDRLKHWVIGSGFRMQSKIDYEVLGMDREEASEWERKIERHFEHWQKHCDLQGFCNFREALVVNLVSQLISGDAFVNTVYEYSSESPYGLRLQLIDSDRVQNPNWTMDTKFQRKGIDISETGRAIAYNVMTAHQNDPVMEVPKWEKISAYGVESGLRRFFHLFERERADQFRGIPYLSTIIEPLQKLTKYSEAELTAAVVSSLFTVFVKKEGSYGLPQLTESTELKVGSAINSDEIALGEGAVISLLPNESIEVANPTRPNTAYDVFWHSVMKQLSASVSIPLDAILLSFQSSYSAARAALLMLWKVVEHYRAQYMEKFCQPIYELWFEEFAEMHDIDVSDILVKEAWTRAYWLAPPKGAIDEKREVSSAVERIKSGISTIQREAEQITGGDWYDIQIQRGLENDLRKKLNLEIEEKKGDMEDESLERIAISDIKDSV